MALYKCTFIIIIIINFYSVENGRIIRVIGLPLTKSLAVELAFLSVKFTEYCPSSSPVASVIVKRWIFPSKTIVLLPSDFNTLFPLVHSGLSPAMEISHSNAAVRPTSLSVISSNGRRNSSFSSVQWYTNKVHLNFFNNSNQQRQVIKRMWNRSWEVGIVTNNR